MGKKLSASIWPDIKFFVYQKCLLLLKITYKGKLNTIIYEGRAVNGEGILTKYLSPIFFWNEIETLVLLLWLENSLGISINILGYYTQKDTKVKKANPSCLKNHDHLKLHQRSTREFLLQISHS